MSVTHCRVARHNLSVTVNDDWNTSCFKCNSSFVISIVSYCIYYLLCYSTIRLLSTQPKVWNTRKPS